MLVNETTIVFDVPSLYYHRSYEQLSGVDRSQ